MAFLDFIIAIEILFTQKNDIAEVLSTRVATLVALGEDNPDAFSITHTKFKKLYDLRSGYVHRGDDNKLADDSLEHIRNIIECISPIILRWNDLIPETCDDKEAHDSWLKLVDYAGLTIKMNRTVSQADQIDMGVLEKLPPDDEPIHLAR